jgi:hypothetical protein
MQKLLVFLALSLVAGGSDHAQQQSSPGGPIYSCTDARGRIFTDRPIPECVDGEQLELRRDGGVRRKVEPARTARELAEREDRDRQARLKAAQQTEQARRDRALLVRYPTAAAHDRERAEALANIDAVIGVARKRIGELMADRKKINNELEFYKKDPSKAPAAVRQRLEDNTRSIRAQERFIGDQEDAKRQLNARFDDERARLRPLWAGGAASRAR